MKTDLNAVQVLRLKKIHPEQAIFKQWQQLVQTEKSPVFSSPEWAFSVQEAFSPRSVLIFFMERADGLINLLPLFQKDAFLWEWPGGLNADYHVPLALSGVSSADDYACLIKAACAYLKPWEKISWPNIPLFNAFSAQLFARLPEWGGKVIRTGCCPILNFKNKGWETGQDYIKFLPKKRRDDIKRLRNRAQKTGGVQYEEISPSSEIKNHLPRFFEIYNEHRGSLGQKEKFKQSRFRKLYENWVEYLKPEDLHFSVLKHQNQIIHYHFGWIIDRHIAWYAPAYDLKFSSWSPGTLHLDALIQHALNEGLSGIDFLQGDEPYKYQWGVEERLTFDWVSS